MKYQIKLFYGYEDGESGIYHAFLAEDPEENHGSEMATKLARMLEVEPGSNSFNWNSTYIDLPDSVAKKIGQSQTIEERDQYLKELWGQFGDIPMNPDTECMDEPFLHFPAGTHRESIWHWFDDRYSKGVVYLLYGNSVDRTEETAALYQQKQLCTECDSETCVFNPDGICKFPFVGGRAPGLNDDGCTDYVYKES